MAILNYTTTVAATKTTGDRETFRKREVKDVERELGGLSKEFSDVLAAHFEGKSQAEKIKEAQDLMSQIERYITSLQRDELR